MDDGTRTACINVPVFHFCLLLARSCAYGVVQWTALYVSQIQQHERFYRGTMKCAHAHSLIARRLTLAGAGLHGYVPGPGNVHMTFGPAGRVYPVR